MSLDYNLTKVHDYEALHEDDLEWNITQAIIFHCMAVGLNGPTESNWQEFYARVRVVERQHGATLTVPVDVEYDPLVVEPPEGTQYVKVNGTLYHYDGTTDYHDEPALLLAVYEHNGFKETRGPKITYVLDYGTDDTFEYHTGKFEPRHITPQDVHRRIGLTTNVANETKSKWTKRMMDSWLREGEYQAKRAKLPEPV